ncbi:hypothetical protein D1007_08971 [Hordeum vulgare]|nr:hypothetical protein D1007_08971 [Hordeum vulgare]
MLVLRVAGEERLDVTLLGRREGHCEGKAGGEDVNGGARRGRRGGATPLAICGRRGSHEEDVRRSGVVSLRWRVERQRIGALRRGDVCGRGWVGALVNSGANEDMQDICIGSQEALFMEPNFSYVALLKGYIDINGGYETINTQGRESCSNDTDNGQTNDGGEPVLQLHQTKTGGINENNKTSHEKGVGAQFSMTSFLREYQRILDNIHANEDELDHNATHKKVSWKTFTTKYYIERQAHNLYNISIFRKFQIILNDVTRLQIREEESMKLYMVYQAKNYYKQEHRARLYVVQVDADRDDYSCISCKFEKDGILCCHILKVMLHLEVDKIPDKYIIDRWRKEGKKMNKPKAIPLKLDNDQLRYNVLGMKLMELGSNASKSQRKFEHLLSAMVRIQQDLIDMDMEGEDEVDEQGEQTEECSKSNRTIGTLTSMVQSGNSNSTVELLNPDKAHTKGRNYSGSGNNKETITSNLPTNMNIQVHQ